MSLDGTKIKAKTSINIINWWKPNQIMKGHLEKNIELDQQKDEEIGDESGNSVYETLRISKTSAFITC